MFDFVRKPLLWSAWDAGLDKEIGYKPFSLKTMQDLAIYSFLREAAGLSIAEIGGSDSRLLAALAKRNRCVNVEKFEGFAGGVSEEIVIPGVENVKAYLGEFDDRLAPESFDVVFSISVVEHVKDLAAFFDDGMRILKPGGLWLHAIDIYIVDGPNADRESRFEIYRSWLTKGALEPIGHVYDGPLKFALDMASHPDNGMYAWGRAQPRLIELRQRAQCVSVLIGGRKRA